MRRIVERISWYHLIFIMVFCYTNCSGSKAPDTTPTDPWANVATFDTSGLPFTIPNAKTITLCYYGNCPREITGTTEFLRDLGITDRGDDLKPVSVEFSCPADLATSAIILNYATNDDPALQQMQNLFLKLDTHKEYGKGEDFFFVSKGSFFIDKNKIKVPIQIKQDREYVLGRIYSFNNEKITLAETNLLNAGGDDAKLAEEALQVIEGKTSGSIEAFYRDHLDHFMKVADLAGIDDYPLFIDGIIYTTDESFYQDLGYSSYMTSCRIPLSELLGVASTPQ